MFLLQQVVNRKKTLTNIHHNGYEIFRFDVPVLPYSLDDTLMAA